MDLAQQICTCLADQSWFHLQVCDVHSSAPGLVQSLPPGRLSAGAKSSLGNTEPGTIRARHQQQPCSTAATISTVKIVRFIHTKCQSCPSISMSAGHDPVMTGRSPPISRTGITSSCQVRGCRRGLTWQSYLLLVQRCMPQPLPWTAMGFGRSLLHLSMMQR